MSLAKKIERDLIDAMKAKDNLKLSTLRLVKAAMANHVIEKQKKDLDDAETLVILQKQAKLRLESLESFKAADRQDLVDKEQKELQILQSYLPKQLTDDEIRDLARQSISTLGAKSKSEMGNIMKDIMPKLKGKADGKRVNSIVEQLLG